STVSRMPRGSRSRNCVRRCRCVPVCRSWTSTRATRSRCARRWPRSPSTRSRNCRPWNWKGPPGMADTLASATGLLAAGADADMEWFAMGYWLIGLSLGVSALGALVGLACVVHGRRSARFRPVWLGAAAISIGGVGIWLATAVPLLGVAVPGSVLRYDAATLGVSLAVIVIAVFAGLVIVGRELRLPRLLTGGLVMGLGGGLMQYLQLSSVDVQGSV